MIISTISDVLNGILALVPNAQVSVHSMDDYANADDGISQISTIAGFVVVWSTQNSVPCPTETQINAITSQQLTTEQTTIQTQQNNNLEAQPYILAGYASATIANPNLTMAQYINLVQNTATSVKIPISVPIQTTTIATTDS